MWADLIAARDCLIGRGPWLTRPLVFLGGLGEIGRNCMAVEQGVGDAERILLVDCGLMFPGPDLHGIDLVLPDFTYLREHADRIDALVATHGHEDHVGGLQFLLREISFPIYGSALTLGLARNRIEEAGLLGQTELIPVADGERRRIGSFDVEFIPVTHSVPHAHAVAIHTPQGVILHSGDFKLDLTPVDDRRTDLARIGELAKTTGIRVLLADSTNAEEPGYAPSERSVGRVLRTLFAEQRDRRIITASFASHLHRIQQIADAAIDNGRKVATLGLSMRKNVQLGMDLGVLKIPASSFIDVEDIDRYPPGEVCVISTGSQGEPMSALALLARGENKFVKLSEHDTVILSSHAIPGNENNVNRVMDGLLKAGGDRHPLGHPGRPRHRSRPGRRAEDLPVDRPARVVRARARRVPPPRRQRRPRRADGRGPQPRARLRERRRAGGLGPRRRDGGAGAGRVPLRRRHRRRRRVRGAARPPAAGQRGCGGGGRHRRHPDRQGARRTGDHHAGLGVRARGRGPPRRGLRHRGRRRRAVAGRRACRTWKPSSATCAGPPASSSTNAPGGGR